MNPINLQVTYIDETTVECSAIAADLIAFEARFDLSVARLGDDVRLTHMFFLAWHALKRTGQTPHDCEKWVESVSMVSEASTKK